LHGLRPEGCQGIYRGAADALTHTDTSFLA
jgi:hypothetical protein